MYEADVAKAQLDEAETQLDQMTLNFSAIAKKLELVRGTLLEVGIFTELSISSGILLTDTMDKQIDLYLREIFQLRTALRTMKEAL